MREALRSSWLRLLGVVAVLALALWGAFALRGVLTPFAVAFAVAYFLNPAVNAMERFFAKDIARSRLVRGWLDPRAAAVGVLAVLVILALTVVVLIIVPAVADQVTETVKKLPEYFRVLRAKVEPAYQRLNMRYPEQTDQIRHQIEEALRTNLPQLLRPVTRVVEAAFSSLLAFVLTVLNLMVIPVFVVYLLYDMNHIQAGAKDLVPHRFREYVYSRVQEVDRLLSAFARGQVTVCLILGAFYSIGLTSCGVPMGLLVGFVIGFFNMIPFMSYVLGLPMALLLSWLDDQSLEKLVAVAVIFTVGQFVEGNFITPRIVGQSLGLHSVVIMLAVLVGGTLLGFIGMLVAVPATAALSIFWADLRDGYLRSDFYRGGAPPAPPPPSPA
ncbi:MAG: AI-2E family transporter [Acidobacteria bacterium]|nr:AI-2E family transporter [Acidobacteriota bacterium]